MSRLVNGQVSRFKPQSLPLDFPLDTLWPEEFDSAIVWGCAALQDLIQQSPSRPVNDVK